MNSVSMIFHRHSWVIAFDAKAVVERREWWLTACKLFSITIYMTMLYKQFIQSYSVKGYF